MKTINNTRLINSKQILNYILFSSRVASQNDLLNILNLDNSTIKRICDTLIEDKILNEETIVIGGKGRRPKAYSINKYYRGITVLVLGTEKSQIYNYHINLDLASSKVITYEKSTPFTTMLNMVIAEIDSSFADICYIITSGSIDNTNKKLLRHYRFNVNNFDISSYFEERIKIPTFAENNMNAFAVNYLYKPENSTLENFSVLSSAQGLGAGFILNGTLYRGFEGNAGEIGHLFYQNSSKKCYCNRNGCFEQFLSTQFFIENNIDIKTIEDWNNIKINNPTLALNIIEQLSLYAAHLLRNIDVTLNIATFFVSGLIFEILLDTDYHNIVHTKLLENQVNPDLILVESNEENFHRGGAILAAIKLLSL